MHWFEQLAAMYNEDDIPLYHAVIYTDIELHLSSDGQLLRIRNERMPTLIPVTAASLHRTSAIVPHPLSDKLRYMTNDYSKPHHDAYIKELVSWADSNYSDHRLCAVRNYMIRGTLSSDISHISAHQDTAVRFVVDDVPLWQDNELIRLHIERMSARAESYGVCCLTGEYTVLSRCHPKHVLSSSGSGKLISYEHRSRILHQGRHLSPFDVFPIGQELSLKAHTVLRRIIHENGFIIGSRTFAAWDGRSSLPLPFSLKLAQPQGQVTVAGFTEATKGRVSVTFLRYVSAERYARITFKWGELGISVRDIIDHAFGHHSRNGLLCSDGLYGSTAERLLGCIIDNTAFPSDIMRALSYKAPRIAQRLTEYSTGESYAQTEL